MMRDRMQTRMNELQSELDTGTRRLQELEGEQVRLQEVMLRITGAIQVLQELLDNEAAQSNGAAPSAAANGREAELAATEDRAAATSLDAAIG